LYVIAGSGRGSSNYHAGYEVLIGVGDGSKEGFNNGSEVEFEDGTSDGIIDGSANVGLSLGVKL
jgi:hypothetical protein